MSNPSIRAPTPYSFRTNAYPAMTVDGTGRVYIAWAERGSPPTPKRSGDGDARIASSTTRRDGRVTFIGAVIATDEPLRATR